MEECNVVIDVATDCLDVQFSGSLVTETEGHHH